jgi:hypothetical protein
MLKRFGIPALALASALAIAAPTMSFARDRGGNERGGQQVARTDFRGRGDDHFDRDRHFDRDEDGGFNYGLNFYAPPPAPSGYYDQYGIWHPYAVGGQYGVSNPYGY